MMSEDATVLDENATVFKELTQDSISGSGRSNQEANPRFKDGKSLPPSWRKHFKPESMACKPLQEIDPAYGNETFIVLGKGGTISRMSRSDSLFLLHPLNALRKWAIYLNTHYIFSAFIVALVLMNIYALVTEQFWFDYACIVIYLLEFKLKVLSRGLIYGEFTCLHNPWNYLDILTILTSVLRPLNVKMILILQWFRILKIIPLIKVMREAFETIVCSIRQLLPAMLLGLMSLCFLATTGLNIYMGILTQRCIKNSDFHLTNDDSDWEVITKKFMEHNNNSTNWIPDSLCGNATNARICPNSSTCHQGFGPNPDFGYTNFDSFLWSFLQAWRMISQDFLEHLIEQIMETSGHYLFYPLFAYFIGTFLVGAFVNGLMAQYLETYFKQQDGNCKPNTNVSDPQTATATDNTATTTNWMKNTLKNIAEHFGFEVFITVVIFFDIFCFFWNMSNDTGFTQYNTLVVLIVYLSEFIIKISGLGTEQYFKNRWNIFDFTITILIGITGIARQQGLEQFGFLVSCIRLFKIVPRWDGLKNMLKITLESLKQFCGIFGLASTFWIFYALVGTESFGHFELTDSNGQVPRWNFGDFTNSFLQVFRSWAKETVESLWDCMTVAGIGCTVYFGIVQLTGILFITVITISIAILTMKNLATTARNEDKPQSTIAKLWELVFTNPIKIIKKKLAPAKALEEVKVLQRNDSEDPDAGDGVDYAEKTKPLPSRTGENMSKLRNYLDSRLVLIISIVLITFTSILLIFEHPNSPQDNTMVQSTIFFTDIFFATYFLCLIVLKVICIGFRSSLSSLTWILDVIIVFEIILHLILDLNEKKVIIVGLVAIRCLRPMLLVTRLERLKVVLLGFWNVLKTGFTYITSLIYILFFFAVIMNALYHHTLTWCNPNANNLLENFKYIHDKDNCLMNNLTWQTASHNFDDGAQSLVTTFLLPSRNGWNTIMHDTFDATTPDGHAHRDNNVWNALTLFVPFYVFGVLVGASIIIGVISSRLRQSPEIFFTTESYKKYFELRNCEELPEEDSMPPRPESGCRGKVFDLVNSKAFSGCTMFTMVFSFIFLSVDSFQMIHHVWEVIANMLYLLLIVLILVEVVLKIIGLGTHFFSSGWNWFDLLTLLLMITSLLVSDLIEKYFISPIICILIRILRLVKNSVFLSMFPTIKTLFKTVSLVKPVLLSILMFHAILIWCYALFWGNVFGHLEHTVRPLSSPFMAMYLLSAFQGLADIYSMLSKEDDCGVEAVYAPGGCGHWGIATAFVFSYAFLSILLTAIFYLVFILELVHQLNLKKDAATKDGIELTNVKDGCGEDGELETVDVKGN